MFKKLIPFSGILALLILIACNDKSGKENKTVNQPLKKGTYAYDRDFLSKHTVHLVELTNEDSSSRILLSPGWQGRVMTSTAMGDSGSSFGWLNYDLLQASEKRKQFNPVGGEERFWIGPEGGQFSFYFHPHDSFNIAHWQVPAVIDTIPYQIIQSAPATVTFSSHAAMKNYSGSAFDFSIERKVSLLTKDQFLSRLGIAIDSNIRWVAYESMNTISNTGKEDWKKQTGLPSIWLLGMFTPGPHMTVIIPFNPVPGARTYITDNYFGKIPAERLHINDSTIYFTCDGKFRGKIGLSPAIAKPLAASYDFTNNTLTLVFPEVHKDAAYVNSKWEIQKEPYKGDVINSYNDGPLADGSQLGPFYELESSSPALELAKGQSGTYRQVTCHLQGDYASLNKISKRLLGVNLDELKP